MKLKYVMIDYGYGSGTPYIFPDYIQHVDFVASMGKTRQDVVSAGFVFVNGDGHLVGYGESISLGVHHNEKADRAFNSINNPF